MKKQAYPKALPFCLICIVAIMMLVFGLVDRLINKTEPGLIDGTNTQDGQEDGIFYKSEWYTKKTNIETILAIGVDKIESENRDNYKQSDFLALIVIDHDKKSIEILHLNRDTMTDIPLLDITGMEYGTTYAQLALAHTHGNDEKARCRNTVKAVQNLLYGVKIDHYISLTMDAVAILNDSIGGVTLELLDDFTSIDKTYVKGAVVTLSGERALTYVRARQSMEDSSNLRRMVRQEQYIGAFFDTYINSKTKYNSLETLLKVNEYMASDCTVNQLSDYSKALEGYSYKGIRTLPGEAKLGDEFIEYYVDESAVRAEVIDLFYTLSEND